MSTIRHRYFPCRQESPAATSRVTIWLLVAIISTLVVALSFGDAAGAL